MVVTNEEKAEYIAFVARELEKLARPLPDALWHYTNGTALISVIESHSLWMTQISCVNDYSEMRYAIELVRRAFQAPRLGTTPTPDEDYLYNRIEAALAIDVVATSEWFIFCLSELKDDLSQWRAYGSGEGGYSVGFQPNALAWGLLPSGYFLTPVTYDRSAHAALTNSVVTATLRFFRMGLATGTKGTRDQWADAFLPAWADALAWLIPTIKDDAFAAEREWRIVHRLLDAEVGRMKYVQRRLMMSRHLPIEFPPVGGKSLLPIAEIVVGPSRYKPISRVSISDLLRTYGYMTRNVTESRIPYQTL